MSVFFESKGYTLWENAYLAMLSAPTTDVVPSGFMYAMHHCGFGNTPRSVADILEYQYVVGSSFESQSPESPLTFSSPSRILLLEPLAL